MSPMGKNNKMRTGNIFRALAIATLGLGACDGQLDQVEHSSQALVTFDITDGTGFVGKGDVQSVFGWNNADLQANADSLTFVYESETAFDVICQWTTGPDHNKMTHRTTQRKSAAVSGAVAYEPRRQMQVSGFHLSGFDGSLEESGGPVPKVGDPCPGFPGNEKAVAYVIPVEGAQGGLYVIHGEHRALLPWPAAE